MNKGPLKKIVSNSGWLILDTIFRYAVGFFVSVWIAKYFGPKFYGTYNYSVAYISLFSAISVLGLKSIVIRELVQNPERKNEILGTTFSMMLFAGIVLWLAAIGIISFLRTGDILVFKMIVILGASFIFQSLFSIKYYFESRVESKYIVIATNIAFIISNILKVITIVYGYSILALAIISLIDTVVASTVLIFLAKKQKLYLRLWKWDKQLAKELLSQSYPLILAGFFATIFLKIDLIMIGEFLDDFEVGLYAVSARLTELWYIIPTIIQTSVFPNLMKKNSDKEALYRKMHLLFSLLTLFSFFVALPIFLFSDTLINLIYGDIYREAAKMLSISIWALFFVCFGVVRFPYLIATGKIKMSMYFGFIGAITNVVLNWFLIPRYGAIGAAYATLISYGCSAYLANFLFAETRIIGIIMTKSLLKPTYNLQFMR